MTGPVDVTVSQQGPLRAALPTCKECRPPPTTYSQPPALPHPHGVSRLGALGNMQTPSSPPSSATHTPKVPSPTFPPSTDSHSPFRSLRLSLCALFCMLIVPFCAARLSPVRPSPAQSALTQSDVHLPSSPEGERLLNTGRDDVDLKLSGCLPSELLRIKHLSITSPESFY